MASVILLNAQSFVMDITGEDTARLLEERFSSVKLMSIGERRTIPQLRTAGLWAARGEIIAVIEDHCIADPHWYEATATSDQPRLRFPARRYGD